MTEKRFTVPLKYSLSHSKIQCDGEPLTNDELVRILNTNDGAFLENFNLKKENKELKAVIEEVFEMITNLDYVRGQYLNSLLRILGEENDVDKTKERIKEFLE